MSARPPWQAVAAQHLAELRSGVDQQRREPEDRRERQDLGWVATLAIVLGAVALLATAGAAVGWLL